MLDGSAIKEARVGKKMTQIELAKIAGVSHATISLLERNMRPNAGYDTVNRVYEVLQLKGGACYKNRNGTCGKSVD